MRAFNICFLAFIFLVGCNDSKRQKKGQFIIQQIDKKYQERKAFFNKEFVNHFPERLDSNYITFTDGVSPEVGPLTLRLINNIDKSQNIKELINGAISKYAANDSCLLVINRFATRDRFYKIELSNTERELINRDCYKGKFPIPNFWDSRIISDSTECRLPLDFIIYVLDAKAGRFVSPDLLTDGSFMPEAWKNGFSKGIAVSEKRKIVIYWVDIW
jgi:hypothetical protein